MRVLVIGGLGFIGSSITEYYVERGHGVAVCDDESSSVIGWEDCPASGQYRCDVQECLDGCEDYFDLIVHCASPVGAAGILPLKGKIASEMVRTTAAVVAYCVAMDTRLVNISTSEVYGFSGEYSESDTLHVPARLSPRIEYALGKMAAEATVRLTDGLNSITIRPFNVVGYRQSSAGGFVLPTFCEQALRGEPITVYGDGTQVRALTGVEDVARFVYGVHAEHYDGRVVNVGAPENKTSILGLARRIQAIAPSGSEIIFTSGKAVHGDDYEEAEGHVKLPSIDLARSMGWRPAWPLGSLISDSLRRIAV